MKTVETNVCQEVPLSTQIYSLSLPKVVSQGTMYLNPNVVHVLLNIQWENNFSNFLSISVSKNITVSKDNAFAINTNKKHFQDTNLDLFYFLFDGYAFQTVLVRKWCSIMFIESMKEFSHGTWISFVSV